jgi:hypothetical protein
MSSGPSGIRRHGRVPARATRRARRLAELFQELAYTYVQIADDIDAEDTEMDD